MRRLMMGVLALVTAASGAAAQERTTDQERRDLEKKLSELRQEVRELERRLGRPRGEFTLLTPRMSQGPLAFTLYGDRARLGVVVQTRLEPATDSIGAVLEAVTPDGPAAEAGLQAGDIVVTLDGKRIATGSKTSSPGDRLVELAREIEEGDSVRVEYRRGTERKTAVIVPRKLDGFAYAFGDLSGNLARAGDLARLRGDLRADLMPHVEAFGDGVRGFAFTMGGSRWADMELTTLDADLGAYFGTTEGLLVVRAPKDSLLGLKSGDVILRIGGRVPTSPSHAVRIFRSYEPSDEVRLDVMRNKRAIEVKATVPERERGAYWEERLD
jgi:C-terminal processing protease CtpA/Prc